MRGQKNNGEFYQDHTYQKTELTGNSIDKEPGHEEGQNTLKIIASIWFAIKRSKIILLCWLIVCVLSAVVYLKASPEIYTAQSVIVLEPKLSTQTGLEKNSGASDSPIDNAKADSQMQIIKSERLLHRVFDELNLGVDPEFRGRSSLASRLKSVLFGQNDLIEKTSKSENPRDDEASFQNFAGRLGVRRVGQSYVIEITYFAQSAAFAARLANSIAMAYVNQQIEAKFAAAQSATEYLEQRLRAFQLQLTAAQSAVKNGEIPDTWFPDADSRVIGAARAPMSISSPQKGVTLAASILFFVISGLVFAVIRQSISDRLYLNDDLGRIANADVLGNVTILKQSVREAPYIISENTRLDGSLKSTASNLIDNLARSGAPLPGRRVGVISWSDTEARSTVASLLAVYSASFNQDTGLIDIHVPEGSSILPGSSNIIASKSNDVTSKFIMNDAIKKASLGRVRHSIFKSDSSDRRDYCNDLNLFLTDVCSKCSERILFINIPALDKDRSLHLYHDFITDIIFVAASGKTKKSDFARLISYTGNLTIRSRGVTMVD
ncbi:Wzz/FepE/Etk N-terminal domain-containing protein [Methylobacterium mesophilicum]